MLAITARAQAMFSETALRPAAGRATGVVKTVIWPVTALRTEARMSASAMAVEALDIFPGSARLRIDQQEKTATGYMLFLVLCVL